MQIETEAAVCGDWSTRLLRRFQGGEQGGGLLSKKKQVTRGASKRAKQLFNSPARVCVRVNLLRVFLVCSSDSDLPDQVVKFVEGKLYG